MPKTIAGAAFAVSKKHPSFSFDSIYLPVSSACALAAVAEAPQT